MPRAVRKQNTELARLIGELRRTARTQHAPIWGSVADRLERPRHQTTPVNVGHLERLAHPQETVVVPGKLLAEGPLSKPLTVGAFAYSEEARSKIQAAGGSAVSLKDLLKSHPDGAGVRLLG
jgi:large subunit ribosomal protein L18e